MFYVERYKCMFVIFHVYNLIFRSLYCVKRNFDYCNACLCNAYYNINTVVEFNFVLFDIARYMQSTLNNSVFESTQ